MVAQGEQGPRFPMNQRSVLYIQNCRKETLDCRWPNRLPYTVGGVYLCSHEITEQARYEHVPRDSNEVDPNVPGYNFVSIPFHFYDFDGPISQNFTYVDYDLTTLFK